MHFRTSDTVLAAFNTARVTPPITQSRIILMLEYNAQNGFYQVTWRHSSLG